MPCQTRARAKRQAEQVTEQRSTRQTRARARARAKQQAEQATEQRSTRQTSSRAKQDNQRAGQQIVEHVTKKGSQKQNPGRVAITFNSLPPEIRLMTWEEFVLTPRIIRIDLHNEPTQADRGFTCSFATQDDSSPKRSEQVCPLLGVNHESRYVALKRPLIHFGLERSLVSCGRFGFQRWFSIRSHDIVFFDNFESPSRAFLMTRGNTQDIANIMIDRDVSRIRPNRSSLRIWAGAGGIEAFSSFFGPPTRFTEWGVPFRDGLDITGKLRNLQHLQNFYLLVWDPTTETRQHFEWDDIQELAPTRFPKHEDSLAEWLDQFRVFPLTWGDEDSNKLHNVWKNVSVGG